MKLTTAELEFLSAWAREEWAPECYRRPAHRLQLAHRVTGAFLIELIKAWTRAEGKKDEDILQAAGTPSLALQACVSTPIASSINPFGQPGASSQKPREPCL